MDIKKKRIGLMGGTFDPVHNAHLKLAERAYRQFSLDEVWMLPNGNPPHKQEKKQEDVMHRMEMLRLAIDGIPWLKLCSLESSGNKYHYTYETLQMLHEIYSEIQFYFIMGADSLFDFDDWKAPEIISKKCIILAANREHCRLAKIQSRIEELHKRYGADIRILDTPDMDIASSEIRQWIRQDKDISNVVPAMVVDYIEEHSLYKTM